jgi:lipopolysaccharide transport system permease protein
MQFNPMYWIVAAYQDTLVYGRAPEIDGLGGVTLAALVLLTCSLLLFRKAAPDMVDVL